MGSAQRQSEPVRGEVVSVPGTRKRKGPGALRSFCEWSRKSPGVPYCSSDMTSQNIKLWLFWSFVIFLLVCRTSSSPRVGSDERRGPETWRGTISCQEQEDRELSGTSSGVGSAFYAHLSQFCRSIVLTFMSSAPLIWLRWQATKFA